MQITRAGLTFDVRDDGPREGVPVVLLHGFPQTSAAWAPLAARLHDAGFRTVAPDQRGYSPGARPPRIRDYALPELVADALAVIDAVTPGPVHLVGHDWGAGVAWALAAAHPDRVRTLTSLATPPPQAMTYGLRSPRQVLALWYMAVIAVPGLVERLHARWPRATARLLQRSGAGPAEAERDAREVRAATLNWYRAMPFAGRTPPRVRVPVLYLWGSGDTALLRTGAEAAARFVDGPFTFVELPGASHWFPEQLAPDVADAVVDFLRSHDEGGPGGS